MRRVQFEDDGQVWLVQRQRTRVGLQGRCDREQFEHTVCDVSVVLPAICFHGTNEHVVSVSAEPCQSKEGNCLLK